MKLLRLDIVLAAIDTGDSSPGTLRAARELATTAGATLQADYARTHQSDLTVLGTRGLGTNAVGRLGSVALGVMRQLDGPILLVPPAVWESYSST